MITTLQNEIIEQAQGPAGLLEMAVSRPREMTRDAWGIVCHPHPLQGGTMYNKVVTTLIKTFQALGIATIRFNFRGVGKSEGQFDQGKGELEDLLAVITWAQEKKMQKELWLGGFSFGAAIAVKAATQLPITKLVAVAPSVDSFVMQHLPPILCPWILAQGDQDEVVDPQSVYAWAAARDPQPHILRFPEAGHFFHGQLSELRKRVERELSA
jgi:alpha/beta superfamily hydrolase